MAKRNRKLSVIVSIAAFVFAQQVLAQATDTTVGQVTTPTTTTPVTQTVSGGGAADNAKKSSGLQTIAMIGAGGVAAWTGSLCATGDHATKMKYCPMAAAAVAATGFLMNSSKDTKKASDQMGGADCGYGSGGGGSGSTADCPTCGPKDVADGGTSTTGTDVTGNGFTPGSAEAKVASEYNQWKSKLSSMGYKISDDGKSVTMPDGSSKSLSNVLTPLGMAGLGMSADEIDAAQKGMKDAAAKATDGIRAVAMTAQGAGSGGGGGGGGGGSEVGDGNASFGMAGADPYKRLRDDNNVAGKAIGTGAETRGVAADDMFRMVHERYKARDAGDSFLKQ